MSEVNTQTPASAPPTQVNTSVTATPAQTTDGVGVAPSSPAVTTNPGHWADGLNEELKGYVGIKGFKDPGAVVESYKNLEKLIGVPKDRLLKLPEKADDPAWNDIYYKLGRPEKVEGYKVEIPKEYGDENFANAAKEAFYKANLTQAQAEAITKWWNGQIEGQTKAQADAQKAEIAKQTEALKQEWGAAFEQNFNSVDLVIDKLGIPESDLTDLREAWGAVKAAKFIHGLSSKIGEHSFTIGDGVQNGSYTPAMAKEAIKTRMQDMEFRNRLLNGDVKAKAEWEQLNRNAVGMK